MISKEVVFRFFAHVILETRNTKKTNKYEGTYRRKLSEEVSMILPLPYT
jgi:hypothetical protein